MSIIDGKRKEKTNSQPVEEQTGFSAYAQERINSAKQTYGKSLIGDPSLAESLRNQAENVIDPTLVNAGKAQYEADRKAYSKKNVTNNFMGVGMQTGAIKESLDKPTNREGWEGLRDNYTYNMDEGTLKKFYSMYGEDKDKAIDYANQYNELKAKIGAVERQENYEQTLRDLGLVRDEVGEGMNDVSRGVAKTMASIGATAMSPYDVAKGIYDLAAGGRHFSQEFIQGNETPFTSMKTDFQNDVKQSIKEASNLEFGDNKVTRFLGLNGENVMSNLYSIGYSTAESMVIAGIGGGAGTILLGTSAGMQTMLQALQQGKSSEKAVAQGLIAGLTEWATERFITLEKVLKAKNMSGLAGKEAVKQYVINQLKAAGAEGSEEFFGSIIDTIADVLINQDDSEIAQLKAEHLAAGEDNPLLGAILDKLGEAVSEGLSGAISGLIMSAGSNALNEAATNASYEREYQAAVEQGTNKELLAKINATEYMNGKTPLTEQSKLKDIVSAYRGSTEAMETNAIKARLVEEGMDEKAATSVSKAIFNKANDYAVSPKEKAQLSSPQAQKVFEEYTKGKESPGSIPWLNESRWRQTEYAKPSSPIVKTVNEIRKIETDELIAEKRKESFDNLAKKYGLDAEEIVKAQPKDVKDDRWAVAIATAYEFGSAGYGIKKVAESTGLNVDGLLTTVYNKGVEKYKSAQVQKTVRAKVDGKGTLPSQAEIDADPTHYHGGRAITAAEMKSDKKLRTGVNFVSRVIAPNISRKVFFYHGDSSVGGERTADAIYINVDAEMDTDSIENGIYYDKGNIIGVFMHEFGHDIRADSPELFDELRQIVVNEVYGGDVKKFDAEVQDYMASRKESGYAVDYDGAVEEIVCDALTKIADNAEHLQKAFVGHQNVAQKLLDYFRKILDSLKEYISSFKQANRISAQVDTEAAEKMVDVLQRYVDLISSETAEAEVNSDTSAKKSIKRYFEESKVRDRNGDLLKMYHGTTEQFTIFDKNKVNLSNAKLPGFWYTSNPDYAYQFGNVGEYYLNITNPIPMDKLTITAEQLSEISGYPLKNCMQALKHFKSDYEAINYLAHGEKREKYIKLIDKVKTVLGYDGYMFKDGDDTIAVTFESNQAKLVSNTMPTSNPDVRFSTKRDKPIVYDDVAKARDAFQKASSEDRAINEEFANKYREILNSYNDDLNKAIPDIKRLQDEYKERLDKAETKLERAKKKYDALDKTYWEQRVNEEHAKEAEAIAKSGLSEADYHRKLARKEFGITGNFKIAGYMMPNGSMLNFGAGSQYGRGEDHRGIASIYPIDIEGGKAMLKFMGEGNIRLMPESPGIDIAAETEPTKQQYAMLKKMIEALGLKEGYFSVDFTETRSEYGHTVANLVYENNINPTRIINDIKYYYATGKVREQSAISQFHYSTKRQPAPTFYSRMGKVISQLKPGKYDSRSIVNMLSGKGVKAEEIKWSGIVPYLEGKKSVTKEELEEFAQGSMLEVEDEWLTDRNWDSNSFDDYFNAENHTYTEAQSILDDMWFFDELKDKQTAFDSLRVDFEDDIFYAYAEIDGEDKMILKYNPRERATRWAQYTLPYTRNYRELKLKMPGADYSNKAMQAHWQESGVLAHARVGDVFEEAEPVTDPETDEVRPMFFIEEIQSDWHNAGSRNGYDSPENIQKRRDGVQKLEGLYTIIEYGLDKFDEDEFTKNVNDILTETGSPLRLENALGFELYDKGLYRGSKSSEKSALRLVINALNGEELAPDAPFKNGKYIEFVMKKLLRTAAEEGYYKIGWTTAKQQAERWSDAYAEGYRIEYDQDIPKFLNKYGKQWGAKVAQEELDNGEIVWTFPINEAMRESVVYEGQPMYSAKRTATIKRINDAEMTAREYLATATLETIRDPEDKAELRKIIAEYQEIDDRKPEFQARIMELLEQKKEQKELVEKLKDAILRRGVTYTADVKKAVEKYGNAKAAHDAIQAELEKTEKALDDTRRQQGKDTRRLREILTMPRVETIIEEQRQLVREYRQLVVATREAGNERLQAVKDKAAAELSAVKAANKERLEKLKERMGEKLQAEIDKRIQMRTRLRAEAKVTRARDYYMPRIQAKVKALEKSISKAPIPFRKPAYEFLSMLDFVTRDKDGAVKPGRANVSREAWRQQINKFLGEGTDSVRDLFAKYNIDVDDAIIKWIEDARAALLAQVDLYTLDVGEVALQRATPEQLAAVYQFADRLNFFIKHLTKEYSDTNLDVSEYTGGVSEHVGKLGKRKSTKVGALERFMRYDNAQAKTVFDRLGEWGQKLFAKLEDSADKYAVNRQTITEFFKQWDQKKVREWMNPKQLVELNLEETDDEGNPITVKFTPTQMMALYCTAKDPDGRRHLIDGEGFKLDHVKENAAGGKGTTSDTIHKFTENDLSNLIKTMNEYDEGLIPFADSLQEFLDTVCTAWGNQVSIRRYGFEQFNVPNYFPLFTVAKDNPQTLEEMLSAYSSSFYGMLNRSFTKDRLPTATNALIIGDIVDIFIAHAADMALYNAYGIAVLDVARFLNYKDPDEGWTMKQRLDDAFGDGVMENYITNLFDSINGQERMSMTDSMFLKGLRLRNRVAVAMNARVVIQQFFSIIRSRDVIAGKYFKPIKDFKGTFHEMMEHGPVAQWKNQGNYQNNIKMPLRQEAIGAETAYGRAVDKVTEWGMKPAEAMDNLAWTMIWDACKNWVNDVQPGLDGDAFYTAVNEKFRDVIYRTQVVDSVLQKSQFMRQQTFVARMLSSFKGESTTSYNLLLRGYDRIMEAKQSGDTAAAWQAFKGPMLRSFATFAVTAIVNALVVSLADAFRDDDDYETMWEKYKEALFGEYREGAGFKSKAQSFLRSNIFESTNPFAIPWVSEIFSILQGYDPDRADLIAIEQAIDTIGNITKLFDNPTRKEVYDILGSLSQLSGFPGQNVYRDVLAMWNSTFGMVDHNLKRQVTPESATSGYEAHYKAMSSGQTVRALTLVDEIMDNVGDSKKAYDGVSTQIRKAYEAGKISEDEAYEYLVMATEYFDIERTEKQQRKRIAGWNKPE